MNSEELCCVASASRTFIVLFLKVSYGLVQIPKHQHKQSKKDSMDQESIQSSTTSVTNMFQCTN